MASTITAPGLSDEKLAKLLALIKGADSVELKLTVPVSDRSKGAAALGVDPLDAQIRQVYFFDTPELTLNKSGLVVRARRVQKKGDDSVVKLRPVVPDELRGKLRRSPSFGVEVDAMPGGFVCSGSMKAVLGPARIGPSAAISETGPGRTPAIGAGSSATPATPAPRSSSSCAISPPKL